MNVSAQQSKIVAYVTILFVVVATAYVFVSPKLYTSRAIVLIGEPRNAGVLSNTSVTDNLANAILVENQIEIMRSDRTLLRVVDALTLRVDSEFSDGASWFSPLLGSDEESLEHVNQNALNRLRKHLSIKRIGLSHLVEVGFSSRDRAKSAQVANAVIDSFITDLLETSARENEREMALIRDSVEQLRVQTLAAETSAQNFRAETGSLDFSSRSSTAQVSPGIVAADEARSLEGARLSQLKDFIEGQVKLRELDSVARSTRAAYETFLQRSVEISRRSIPFEVGISKISPAIPPIVHSSPRLIPTLVAAVFVGLVLGGLIAFASARFRFLRAGPRLQAGLG